jgi:hypothetical protein
VTDQAAERDLHQDHDEGEGDPAARRAQAGLALVVAVGLLGQRPGHRPGQVGDPDQEAEVRQAVQEVHGRDDPGELERHRDHAERALDADHDQRQDPEATGRGPAAPYDHGQGDLQEPEDPAELPVAVLVQDPAGHRREELVVTPHAPFARQARAGGVDGAADDEHQERHDGGGFGEAVLQHGGFDAAIRCTGITAGAMWRADRQRLRQFAAGGA